jgi:DNA-directed RNA polymerase beta' subunit
MSYVVGEIQVNAAVQSDYEAHHLIKPGSTNVDGSFLKYYIKKSGYNPGSPLGNRQVCEVCGQSGSECKGHPVVLDLSEGGNVYLNEFGVRIITILTSLICRRCRTVVYDSRYPNLTFDGLIKTKIPDGHKRCLCESKPQIEMVTEQKIEEKDKEYEWRNGRRHQKKAKRLVLSHGGVGSLRDLIREVAEKDLSGVVEEGGPNREKGELERIGLKREFILGLFYDKMFLQPVCVHPMTFKRGVQSGVDEISGTSNVYMQLFINSVLGNTQEIQQIQRDLYVGAKAGRFSGTQSHIASADGKKGLYRGPAQAKRSRNTSRAVLTPNAYGHSGEIVCPRFITKNLQYKYVVSEHNKYYLQSRVGHEVSHFVVQMESSTLNDREMYKKISVGTELKLGDVVLKTIEDGDHVMFHRHPTLHRHSMISYRCYESSEPVIKLHETNTQGHNADFDGDEGNITIGATMASRIELAKIDAAYNLFGGRSGEPVVGIAYNGIVGAFILSTNDDIPEKAFKQLVDIITERTPKSQIRIKPLDINYYKAVAARNNIPFRSGRTLISMLLPQGLYYERKKKVTVRFALGTMAETKLQENWNKGATHVVIDAKYHPIKIVNKKAVFSYEGNEYSIPAYSLESGEELMCRFEGIKSVVVDDGDKLQVDGQQVSYRLSGMKVEFVYNEVGYSIGLPQLGRSYEMATPDVVISNGVMLRGNLRSVDVSNKLITAIAAVDSYAGSYYFVDRGYAMMSKYIDIFGLTIGAKDYVKLGKSRDEVLPTDFEERLALLDSEVQVLERNKISSTPSTAERIENQISHKIDELVVAVQEVLTDGPYRLTHNAAISYGSGARGSVGNIMSATSMVGQMYTVNRRYNPKQSRASYYADPDSLSIHDRSFIATSYAHGLPPPSVMQVADPARAQALNTYLGTPESGKAARETELHQDGIHVNYMLSLVGRDGKIMDLLAGYGCNGTRVTYRKTPLGMLESPVDPMAVLHKIKSRQ